MTDPDERETAVMQLLLSPEDVTPAVISAALNTSHAADARAPLVGILERIYGRDTDQRIADGFRTLTSDRDPLIRREVVRALGDAGQTAKLSELFELLEVERDETVL